MGGLSGVMKAGKPKNFKEFLTAGAPGTWEDKSRSKRIHEAFWSPQPYEGPGAPGPRGPTMAAMTEEELEAARRRRGTPRRPASTVLTASGDGDTLGG